MAEDSVEEPFTWEVEDSAEDSAAFVPVGWAASMPFAELSFLDDTSSFDLSSRVVTFSSVRSSPALVFMVARAGVGGRRLWAGTEFGSAATRITIVHSTSGGNLALGAGASTLNPEEIGHYLRTQAYDFHH